MKENPNHRPRPLPIFRGRRVLISSYEGDVRTCRRLSYEFFEALTFTNVSSAANASSFLSTLSVFVCSASFKLITCFCWWWRVFCASSLLLFRWWCFCWWRGRRRRKGRVEVVLLLVSCGQHQIYDVRMIRDGSGEKIGKKKRKGGENRGRRCNERVVRLLVFFFLKEWIRMDVIRLIAWWRDERSTSAILMNEKNKKWKKNWSFVASGKREKEKKRWRYVERRTKNDKVSHQKKWNNEDSCEKYEEWTCPLNLRWGRVEIGVFRPIFGKEVPILQYFKNLNSSILHSCRADKFTIFKPVREVACLCCHSQREKAEREKKRTLWNSIDHWPFNQSCSLNEDSD